MVQNIRLDMGKPSRVVLVVDKTTRKEEPPTMSKKRLTTNGNVFRRTDGRWQSVIWYFDEQGKKMWKTFFWITPFLQKTKHVRNFQQSGNRTNSCGNGFVVSVEPQSGNSLRGGTVDIARKGIT